MKLWILLLLTCVYAAPKKRFNLELSYRQQSKRAKASSAGDDIADDDGFGGASSSRSSRQVLGGMFLENKLSALDISKIQNAQYNEGNNKALQWAKAGNWGNAPKNLCRDVMRSLKRGMQLPSIFYWPVPLWDLQADKQVHVSMPFLLPHEIIHHFVLANGIQPYLFSQPSKWQQLCDDMTDKLHLPKQKTVHIGFHGDGVPFSKSDSIEILAINFLAQPRAQRVPFTAVSKKHLCKCGCLGRHTWHAILSVFKWSMLMLLAGKVRHYPFQCFNG